MLLIVEIAVGIALGLTVWIRRATLLDTLLGGLLHVSRLVLFLLLAVGVIFLIGWAALSQNFTVQMAVVLLVAAVLWWAKRRERQAISRSQGL